jgi:hypothetical protein
MPHPADEVVQFYNANKTELEGNLADSVTAIREYLRSDKRQAVTTFVTVLKKNG